MPRKLFTTLVAAVAGCAFLTVGAGAASAGTGSATLEIRKSPRVLWVQTSVPSMDAQTLHFKVLAPTGPDGRRELWQFCKIDYAGPGTYRCGVDTAPGSTARGVTGWWAARLYVDGELAARKVFEMGGG